MSKETLAAFLKKVAADEVLRKEFTQFAAEHGFDLGELSDEDLDAVAGGGSVFTSKVTQSGGLEPSFPDVGTNPATPPGVPIPYPQGYDGTGDGITPDDGEKPRFPLPPP